MADDIGECLANNLQNMDLSIGIQLVAEQVVLQLDLDSTTLPELGNGILERNAQARFADTQTKGGQQFTQLAIGTIERGTQHIRDLENIVGALAIDQVFFQSADLNLQIGERLGQRVMQLTCNNATLFQQ